MSPSQGSVRPWVVFGTPAKNKQKKEKKAKAQVAKPKSSNNSQTSSKPAPRKAKGLFSGIGSLLGAGLGGPAGGIVGGAAGSLLGDLFGFGDYEATPPVNFPVVNNTTLGFQTPMAAQIPLMHSGDGTTRLAKREYIGDVTMSQVFSNQYYKINPTSTILFPWLSSVAVNYEQFKFLGLTFAFRSLTANALGIAGSPAMGSVTFATEYDVNALPCNTKSQASSMIFSTSCKPSESMMHPIECDPSLTPTLPLFTGAVSRNLGMTNDERLQSLGYLQVVTQGAPVTGGYPSAGELWVTYDILLIKPLIRSRALTGVVVAFKDGGHVTAPASVSDIGTRFADEKKATSVDEFSTLLAAGPTYD